VSVDASWWDRDEKARHGTTHDGEVTAPERATEGPEYIGSDTEQPFAHWVVVAAGAPIVVIGHG